MVHAIEDQSRFPPQPGEGPVLETAGGEGAGSARTAGVRALARPRRGLSPARGKGRRADPLARVGSAAPQLPRLSRHQGRLWKQTWASPPALARSRSLSVSSLIYAPDCRGAGGGRRRGRGRADGSGEGGVAAGMGGRQAGRLVAGREASSGSSGQVRGGRLGVDSGRAGRQSPRAETGRSGPPYKAERNSQSRRRLAPAARRAERERGGPRGRPGDR